MLIIPPVVYRKRRRTKNVPVAAPVVNFLQLVFADFDFVELTLTLVFDRPMNAGGFDPAGMVVNDGVHNHQTFAATAGASVVDEVTLLIPLEAAGAFGGSAITLNAPGGNGIVAINNNEPWPGGMGIVLPFGG